MNIRSPNHSDDLNESLLEGYGVICFDRRCYEWYIFYSKKGKRLILFKSIYVGSLQVDLEKRSRFMFSIYYQPVSFNLTGRIIEGGNLTSIKKLFETNFPNYYWSWKLV